VTTVEKIHSYLIHPAKAEEDQPQIGGAALPKTGPLVDMLDGVFVRASKECDIEIAFRPDASGRQNNACRDDLVRYVGARTLPNGRRIAERLQASTTHRSGLGLLFVMTGNVDGRIRLVVSRFPADQGILAEEDRDRLTVEFLERVFMKNAKAYKSVVYESNSATGGFWDGRAVDRQITGPREVSEYWIREFLESELRTTGAAGTRRLAVALRAATRTASDLAIRQELISAAHLMRRRDGKAVTGTQLVGQLGLSDEATEALTRLLPRADLMDERFVFDRQEFDKHLHYRAIELDNGGLMIAEDDGFDEVFVRQDVNPAAGLVRYSTEGRIVDERLRKRR
jgi:hypothetical protein